MSLAVPRNASCQRFRKLQTASTRLEFPATPVMVPLWCSHHLPKPHRSRIATSNPFYRRGRPVSVYCFHQHRPLPKRVPLQLPARLNPL